MPTKGGNRQRRHDRGLTLPQQNAVDLLAAGKTDTETAASLGLARETVCRWRIHDPVFQAALNRERAAIWGAGIDRLRSLIPAALDVIGEVLENGQDGPTRLKAALEVLRLAQLPADSLHRIGPAHADEIVWQLVAQRRAKAPGPFDYLAVEGKNLPPIERQVADAWQELDELAGVPHDVQEGNGG